jgi:hypothetical protein
MADREDPLDDRPKGTSRRGEDVEVRTVRAVEALGTGVRTTLRNNATAYGYSVTITAAFGTVQASQSHSSPFAIRIILFAAGAAGAFLVVDLVASHWFRSLAGSPSEREVMIGGAVDALAVLAAVGSGIGLALIPGPVAWPVTAFGVTVVFLVVSGINVLVARHVAQQNG